MNNNYRLLMTKCDNRWLTLSVWLTGAPTWPGSSGRRTSSCSTTSSSPRKSGSLSHMSYAFTYNFLSSHKRLNFFSFLSIQTKKGFVILFTFLTCFNLVWPTILSSAFMLWIRNRFISREDRNTIASLTLQFFFRQLCKREEHLLAELRDVKDQSELLEFRVLELEEGQDKVSSGSWS